MVSFTVRPQDQGLWYQYCRKYSDVLTFPESVWERQKKNDLLTVPEIQYQVPFRPGRITFTTPLSSPGFQRKTKR
jgi:hypothetical protein